MLISAVYGTNGDSALTWNQEITRDFSAEESQVQYRRGGVWFDFDLDGGVDVTFNASFTDLTSGLPDTVRVTGTPPDTTPELAPGQIDFTIATGGVAIIESVHDNADGSVTCTLDQVVTCASGAAAFFEVYDVDAAAWKTTTRGTAAASLTLDFSAAGVTGAISCVRWANNGGITPKIAYPGQLATT